MSAEIDSRLSKLGFSVVDDVLHGRGIRNCKINPVEGGYQITTPDQEVILVQCKGCDLGNVIVHGPGSVGIDLS